VCQLVAALDGNRTTLVTVHSLVMGAVALWPPSASKSLGNGCAVSPHDEARVEEFVSPSSDGTLRTRRTPVVSCCSFKWVSRCRLGKQQPCCCCCLDGHSHLLLRWVWPQRRAVSRKSWCDPPLAGNHHKRLCCHEEVRA